MSTIAQLSDAELDTVAGGLLNFAILTGPNLNFQAAAQGNAALITVASNQGGEQTQNNVQNSGNFSGIIAQIG